jgi:ribosomal protein S18 acetylase RimI-like enzyme
LEIGGRSQDIGNILRLLAGTDSTNRCFVEYCETAHMMPHQDYYLKIPFVWEPGCPLPGRDSRLRFRPAPAEWLAEALSKVLESSLDPADLLAVAEHGAHQAAALLLSLASPHFEQEPDWWQLAETQAGDPVGFVLCSIFAHKGRRPLEGTIFYMGVLPVHRGKGYGRLLLDQATRTLVPSGVSRILCDTAADNAPMIAAFRQAGYIEKPPWERPLR